MDCIPSICRYSTAYVHILTNVFQGKKKGGWGGILQRRVGVGVMELPRGNLI